MSGPLENGIFYALLAGCFWGITPLLLKRGMTLSNVSTATLVQQSVIVLTLVVIATARGAILPANLAIKALWGFVAAGIAGASLGKILYNKGIDSVGASKTVSIKNSDPVVTVLLLALILGEDLTLPVAAGVALIVSGIFLITRIGIPAGEKPRRLAYYFYPLASVFFYGMTPVFKKIGMEGADLPELGALITQFSGLLVILTLGRLLGIRPRWQGVDPKSLSLFALAGFTESLGSLSTFYSLRYAPAVIVAPIWRISPLVAFAFARFTLRGIEVVTLKDGLAAGLIVLGVLVLYQG